MDAISLFEYVMIPPAIVLGLAITHLLSGLGRIVHRLAGHGPDIHLDWVHLVWVAHLFFWIVFFWWYGYKWSWQADWNILEFVFLIFYTITLYLMCVVLIPDDLDEVSDFQSYFMTLRKWFFGGVITLILIDFIDSAAKGWENVLDLGANYLLLRTFLLVGGIFAVWTVHRRYHSAYAIVGLVWTLLYFSLNRPTIVPG